MIRAILVPNIAEGIAKGLFGAAFVALLLFLVIFLMRHRAGNALVGVHLGKSQKIRGKAKCRPQSLGAQ